MLLPGMLLLGGCEAAPVRVPPTSAPADAVTGGPAVDDGALTARSPHLLTGALRGRTRAWLTLDEAAARVNVRAAELPGLLYRISTPADSGLAPRVVGRAGRVALTLTPTGADGPDRVDILVNRRVRWRIRLIAGAGEQHLDLSKGKVSGLRVGAGVGLVHLRLPPPRGTVPVVLTGSVGTAEVVAPPGAPVSVRAARGAARVALPWTVRSALASGAVLTPPGWTRSVNRYRVDALATLNVLNVRASGEPVRGDS